MAALFLHGLFLAGFSKARSGSEVKQWWFLLGGKAVCSWQSCCGSVPRSASAPDLEELGVAHGDIHKVTGWVKLEGTTVGHPPCLSRAIPEHEAPDCVQVVLDI